jgi:cysteine-rich repeat protein
VRVPPAGMLVVSGIAGAENLLEASGQMTVQGKLTATPGGDNLLEYRVQVPDLTGASINPAATVMQVATLPDCVPVVPVCGDHMVQAGEECDDGNLVDCDGCDSSCRTEGCPNGRVECTEACDDGNLVDGDGCDTNCTTTVCGNHIVTAGEECDDGNRIDGDGCSATCEIEPPPGCGDGVLETGEECDDHNTTSCDGCSKTCTRERCGNNIPECDEECDQGGTVCNGCSATCHVERCGDGITACGETCDAGAANGTPGSGCTSQCQVCTLGSGTDCPCRDDLDCHPLGRCAGVGCEAGLCVSVPVRTCGPPPCTDDAACDDGDRCNGAERCSAGVCSDGPALDCDDRDPCTDDACDATAGCANPPFPGFAGARCRLGSVATIAAAAGVSPSSPLGRKLAHLTKTASTKLERAAAAHGKRQQKLLRAAEKPLAAIGKQLDKAVHAGELTGSAADMLRAAVSQATQAVRASLTA